MYILQLRLAQREFVRHKVHASQGRKVSCNDSPCDILVAASRGVTALANANLQYCGRSSRSEICQIRGYCVNSIPVPLALEAIIHYIWRILKLSSNGDLAISHTCALHIVWLYAMVHLVAF